MSHDFRDPREDQELSTEQSRLIDACCARFEAAWKRGTPLKIEEYLQEWKGVARRALLRELLAIEIENRTQSSLSDDWSDFKHRFPDDHELLAFVSAEARVDAQQAFHTNETNRTSSIDAVPEFLKTHPRYHILRRLASGGMGTIWLAEHSVLGRQVAIKVIRGELISHAEARSRFLQEAQTAAQLNHAHVVTIFDAEADHESPFLVMEYLEGADLGQHVRSHGPMRIAEACDAICQAARGLAAAHAAGFVHRDLSPRNLMRTSNGTIKLLDFGLASLLSGTERFRERESGALIGTADFMAPEQAIDPSSSDIRSDLYSLGCVLYFLLVGQPPYSQKTVADRLKAHATDPIPDLIIARPDTPSKVAATFARLLAKLPENRVGSPAELIQLLAPFSNVVSNSENSISPRRRRISLSIALLALLSMFLAIGTLWITHPWGGGSSSRTKFDPNDLVLQESRHLLAQREETQVRAAIERLDRLIASNPQNSKAHAVLAESWNLLGDYGWGAADDCFPRAIESARRSLQINPDLADAHLALAFAWHSYDCDWDQAEREYRRTIALDDQLSSAHHWLAWLLVQRENFQEARSEVLLAHELAPLDLIVMNNVGKIAYYSRDFVEAEKWHRRVLGQDPDFRKARLDLGYTLIELKQTDAALSQFVLATGLSTGSGDVTTARAYAIARSGRLDEARALLIKLESSTIADETPLELARLSIAVGDLEKGLQLLEQAFEQRSPGRAGLCVDPRWDPIRENPRFQKLERRLLKD